MYMHNTKWLCVSYNCICELHTIAIAYNCNCIVVYNYSYNTCEHCKLCVYCSNSHINLQLDYCMPKAYSSRFVCQSFRHSVCNSIFSEIAVIN